MHFGYRDSLLKKNKFICLSVTLQLEHKDKDEILTLIKNRKQRRISSQPLNYPSAGSVFRNTEGDYAGRLIESLGYKGKGINDAIVSEKHANFIINKGKATGEDIKKLITKIQDDVKKEYNIDLILEQEIIE